MAGENRMRRPDIQLRRIPYPYKAMLAICSDLDRTSDRVVYWEIARFLNTRQQTAMGPGLALEVGNTIYFDMPDDQFAYWNTDDAGREMIRSLIRSGHIDCLHSYGDLATTREHAARALDELDKHDCRLHVWVDHGTAATNFGIDIMQGRGDEPDHEAYHADLTIGFGVRYVWLGRVTSILGQDIRPHLGTIFTDHHPLGSLNTLAKEAAKVVLARLGSTKYAMHGPNHVLREIRLRNGSPVHEFIRSNPHWAGVSSSDKGREIGKVLTGEMLDRLMQREGVCILYTHLGKTSGCCKPFDESGVSAFRRLARYYYQDNILVLTTHRLLRYLTVRDHLRYRVDNAGEELSLTIESVDDPVTGARVPSVDELRGITFVTEENKQLQVRLCNGQIVPTETIHHGETTYATVSWRRLEFPDIQQSES